MPLHMKGVSSLEPTNIRLTIPDSVNVTMVTGPADALLRRIERAFDYLRRGIVATHCIYSNMDHFLSPVLKSLYTIQDIFVKSK